MEDWEKELIETKERSRNNAHRLDDVEAAQYEEQKELKELTATVRLLAQSVEQFIASQRLQMEQLLAGQKAQGERIGALERQPAEYWKLVVRTIITGVAGILAGGIGTLLLLNVK